jgi:hypothetical protein
MADNPIPSPSDDDSAEAVISEDFEVLFMELAEDLKRYAERFADLPVVPEERRERALAGAKLVLLDAIISRKVSLLVELGLMQRLWAV